MSLEICSHSRQLVGCQMPNFFSRIAGRSPRVSTASRKLFAIVSATVSTAGLAMLAPPSPRPLSDAGLWWPVLSETETIFNANSFSAPSFLLFPAPLAARAGFLGAKIELLDVLGMHQSVASVVHHDTADLEHVAVMRRLKRHLGILLDQKDRHALLLVNAPDDGENLSHQDRRQAKRRLVEQQQRRAVHQRAPDRQHLLLAAGELSGRLVDPLLQPGKITVDPLQILRDTVAIAARI